MARESGTALRGVHGPRVLQLHLLSHILRGKGDAVVLIGDAGTLAVIGQAFGGHFWHVIIFGSWAPIFAVTLLGEKLAARLGHKTASAAPGLSTAQVSLSLTDSISDKKTFHDDIVYREVLALTLICAATIHLFVMPDHFAQSLLYGSFFLVAGIGQIGAAATLLVRPSRALVKAALAGSVFMVATWLLSRTAGVPIGPDNGGTEPFGILDILAAATEGIGVAAGTLALKQPIAGPAWKPQTWPRHLQVVAGLSMTGTVLAGLFSSHS